MQSQKQNISPGTQVPGSLEQAIKNVTRAHGNYEGVVIDRNMTAFTCTVKVGTDATGFSLFYNVPMQVLIGSQASVMQIPATNSDCLIMFKDGNIQRPQLGYVDTCEKFLISIGGSTLEVDGSLFKFNGGTNGGMVLVNLLVNQLNALQNAFNAHVHSGVTTGAGVSGPSDLTVTLTTAADIESTVITQ